jgi:hypothetical protein
MSKKSNWLWIKKINETAGQFAWKAKESCGFFIIIYSSASLKLDFYEIVFGVISLIALHRGGLYIQLGGCLLKYW